MPESDEINRRVGQILLHKGTMATVLYSIAVREFGEEVHEWEPETVFMEMRDAFGVDMPPENHDKLMALLVGVSSDAFYQKWSAFEVICRAINTGDVLAGDELLVAEMAWGVAEVTLNDDTPSEFSPEIQAGVGRLLMEDGFIRPPAKLSFAKIPERYLGSSTSSDMGREDYLSTEHEKVVSDYLLEQSALLLRQISALPWQTEDTLVEILEGMAR